MSQNKQLIEGTNIPQDPRKRTKNHARIDVIMWVEMSDKELSEWQSKNAVDALRSSAGALEEDLTEKYSEGDWKAVKVDVRVSQ